MTHKTAPRSVRAVGDSSGVIPKPTLEHLGVSCLIANPVPGAVVLITDDSQMEKSFPTLFSFMEEQDDAFRELSMR